MKLKIKYISINKLGDVFEWHRSHTLWCPVCLQDLVLSNEYALTLVGGGVFNFCVLFMKLSQILS